MPRQEWTQAQREEIEAEWFRHRWARCPLDGNSLRCQKQGLYRGFGDEWIFSAHCISCGNHFTQAHTHNRESA